MGRSWPVVPATALLVAAGCTASAPPPSAPSASASAPPVPVGVGGPVERTIFVATTGDDAAPGSEARPLKTLTAAQAAVRSALAQGAQQNIRVQIASGTYPLTATLTFDQRDSPADGLTVRWTGPADASAVLTAAREITGWEKFSGDISRAKLPPGLSFSTLFENGQRATLARTPNDGYARVEAAVGSEGSSTQFVYRAGDVPEGVDPATATVYLWPGCSRQPTGSVNHDWETDVIAIKAIDARTRTVTLVDQASYPICEGNRYFVQGSRALIDRAGEFAIEQGYVYHRPRAHPIDAQRIVAPGLGRLVEVKGASESALAKNITFERLTFTLTDAPRTFRFTPTPGGEPAAIHVENAENISVRSSRISDVGGNGVTLRGHAQRVVIESDAIERVGMHGVWIKGPFTSQPRTSKDNRVVNNRIRFGGLANGSGAGVKVENSAANDVANNEISDMPRAGIYMVGATLSTLRQFEPQVQATAANLNDLRHARENVVRRNDIFRVMTDSQDAAGIYVWGLGPGNRLEENRIHDIDTGDRRDGFQAACLSSGPCPSKERGPLLYGFYFDDGSDLSVARGNVVYGIRGPNAGGAMVKGIGTQVSGNVFVVDGGSGGINSVGDGKSPVEALRISGNVIVGAVSSDSYWWRAFSEKTVAEADRNLFFGAAPTVRFRFGREVIDLDQWRARYGFDKASVIADPLFVDPAKGDYRVRDGSPALALGFVNVEPSTIGLRPDFPFKR